MDALLLLPPLVASSSDLEGESAPTGRISKSKASAWRGQYCRSILDCDSVRRRGLGDLGVLERLEPALDPRWLVPDPVLLRVSLPLEEPCGEDSWLDWGLSDGL